MSEIYGFREPSPSEREASQESIQLFLGVIINTLKNDPTAYEHSDGSLAGSYYIDREAHDSLNLHFRPLTSEELPIEDWLTRKEIPDAVAVYFRCQDSLTTTNDPLSLHTEIEEMWIRQTGDGFNLRKRVYSYEQPNYPLLDELPNTDYNAQIERFNELKEAQIIRQHQIDQEEELLGLNRVSEAEVHELVTLLRGGLRPTAEFFE